MAGTIRCGRCKRPILAGDAFQCTSCSLCYHASCWIGTPSCTCGSATNRVVHLASNGEIMPQQTPGRNSSRTSLNQYASDTGGMSTGNFPRTTPPANSTQSTALQQSTKPGNYNEELECSHCLLPVDTLDQPCPFCGHQPIGRNHLVIRNGLVNYDDAPWGLRAISAINQASAVISWFIAGCLLIPFLAAGEVGAIIMATAFATSGYLNWRLGTDLLKKKHWARTVQTIFAVFALFGFPLFTMWGALTLWGLHSGKAEDYFDEKSLLPEKTD